MAPALRTCVSAITMFLLPSWPPPHADSKRHSLLLGLGLNSRWRAEGELQAAYSFLVMYQPILDLCQVFRLHHPTWIPFSKLVQQRAHQMTHARRHLPRRNSFLPVPTSNPRPFNGHCPLIRKGSTQRKEDMVAAEV